MAKSKAKASRGQPQSGETIEVALDDIVYAPKYDGVQMDQQKIKQVAKTIRLIGLLNAIIVRPAKEPKPGRLWECLAGRTRVNAVRYNAENHGGPRTIRALVRDVDDPRARFTHLTENLARSDYKESEKVILAKEWIQLFEALEPPRPSGGLTGGRTLAARKRGEPPPPTKAETGDQNFAEALASATGMGRSTVYTYLALGDCFTEDQLRAFDRMGVPQDALIRVMREIKDKGARQQAIDLILSGMAPHAAVDTVVQQTGRPPARPSDKAPKAPEPASVPMAPPEPQPTAPTEADMTDAEWLKSLMEPDPDGRPSVRFRLDKLRGGDTTNYDAQALLWRWFDGTRASLFQQSRGILSKRKLTTFPAGPYADIVLRFAYTTHPRLWPLCGACDGEGRKDGAACKACATHGYRVHQRGAQAMNGRGKKHEEAAPAEGPAVAAAV